MADLLNEVRAAVKEKDVVIGADETLKLLRNGKIKKVFLAANVQAAAKQSIHRYGTLGNVEVVELRITNEELGTLCKKPFSISVIGVSAE